MNYISNLESIGFHSMGAKVTREKPDTPPVIIEEKFIHNTGWIVTCSSKVNSSTWKAEKQGELFYASDELRDVISEIVRVLF